MKTQPTQCLTLFAPVIALILICSPNSRAASGYAAAVQADGPIAYYRFNDAAPPTAVNDGSLGAAASGTYFNGAAPGAQAPQSPAFLGFEANNTALQCDGVNDYVSTISGLLNSRPVFTISGWMRRNANQNDRTGLWGQNDIVEFGYINNNTLEVWTDNGLDITPNSIPNGEWAHLAIVSDGSPGTMSMYTNGVLAGSRAPHSLPIDNAFAFNIGGGGVFDASGNFFNGQIDEVAIFTTAFTAAQIAAQYQAAFTLPAKTNVFAPGDPIVLVNGVNDGDADAGPPPGGETVDHSIDRFGQKYLNFLDLGSGFATTPSLGPTIVQCIRFYTANDAEERDPASYLLEGSVSGLGGPWTTIASGPLSLPSGRNAGGVTPIDPATQVNQLVAFPNTTPYTSYRVTFPTLKNAAAANSMQIGEVELLGASFPAAPTIVSQPTNITVRQALSATFRVTANGSAPLAYQWFCKRTTDAAFAAIPGATAATYTTPPTVYPDDDNKQFKVQVSNAFGTVDSQVATLRVNADNVPPSIVSTSGSADFLHVSLLFSEELDSGVAVDTFNYSIDGGLSVIAAELSPDMKSVLLTVNMPMAENTIYQVTAHAKDLAGNEADLTASVRSWATDKCGGLVFEAYFGIDGTAISGMTSNPNFPNNPSERGVLKVFDTRDIYPNDSHENYGGSARGLFIPSVSGPWIFYLASDDASQLFLNPNGPDAAGKVLIAEEVGCCGQWGSHASAPQNLIAGRGYYIQGLYKEGGGGDYLKVAARLQGQPVPEDDPNQQQTVSVNAIPGGMLGYPAAPVGVGGEVTITQQPQGATVEANHSITFTVAATNPNGLPQCYQWMRDGQPILGATGPSYTTTVTAADDNTCFNVMVAIIGDSKTSANACVRVVPDTTPPRCIGAAGTANLRVVVLTFDERLARGTAEDPFNYSIQGFSLMGNPSLDASETVVTLTLDPPLTPDTAYCVDIRGVTDVTGNPIVVPNAPRCCFRTWQLCQGVARREIYMNIGAGVAITDLTGNPKYPNSPDVVNFAELLEGPIDNQMQDGTDLLNNYGERISGFLIPPVTGNYNFWISSDDLSEFWLSTDADPSHKVLVCREPEWNGIRNWTGAARRPAPAANASTTLFPVGISLTAGQLYYFETLHKEGGGGDGCEVTWQTPAGGPSPGLPVNSDGVDATGSGGNGNGGTKAILGRYMATLVPPGTDSAPPTVLSCKALAPRTRVVVKFSEIVRAAAAENTANYSISGGIAVTSATLQPDQRSVELIAASAVPPCSTLTVNNIGDCVNNLIAANTAVSIDVVGGYLASGPQNLIVIEAEHIDNRVNQAGLRSWSAETANSGYSGDGYTEILIDGFRRFHGNTQNLYGDFGARADYVVNFPVAGTYYLWVRGATESGTYNSFHMGVDGVNPGDTVNRIGNRINNWGGTATGWGWINDAQTAPGRFDITTAGLHMINIWPREDHTRIDKFVLTTDAAFTLAGVTTAGPPESTREDTVSPVLTCPNGVQVECGGANPTWTATAVDDRDGPVPVTCTPASGSPFPLGCTTVTCRATDAAGNPCTCSFQVCVVDESAPVVTCPADIVVPFTSPNGATVAYVVGCQDTCGIRSLTCSPPGSQFPCGTTLVTCVCTDTAGNEGRCSFRVTVVCNRCPVPVLSASALCNGPQTNTFISPNGSNVCFVLDGSLSFDPDGDTLTYHWLMGAIPFASGPKTTNCFPVGEKTITLLVDDGKCVATTNITITVLTACEAVEDLIMKVNNSDLARKNKRPFLASLKAACASFERGNFNSGSQQLGAFINKVRAQLSRNNPDEAALFTRCAQNILDSLNCAPAGGP